MIDKVLTEKLFKLTEGSITKVENFVYLYERAPDFLNKSLISIPTYSVTLHVDNFRFQKKYYDEIVRLEVLTGYKSIIDKVLDTKIRPIIMDWAKYFGFSNGFVNFTLIVTDYNNHSNQIYVYRQNS
jgi:hypothetical protein